MSHPKPSRQCAGRVDPPYGGRIETQHNTVTTARALDVHLTSARRSWCLLALCVGLTTVWAEDALLPLVPYPKSVVREQGAFRITDDTTIVVSASIADADANGAAILNEHIAAVAGQALPVKRRASLPSGRLIAFDGFGDYPLIAQACASRGFDIPGDLPAEGYAILARPEGILVAAKDRRGMVCAALTLGQLLSRNDAGVQIPCCRIVDYPSMAMRICHMQVPAMTVQGWNLFEWRAAQKPGLYEHFQRMEDFLPILEQMTQMALQHKMNGVMVDLCNVFRFRSCPAMALPQAMPMEDLAPIIRMARRYYADAIPYLNLFAHQEHFLAKSRPDLMLVKLSEFPKKRVSRYDDFFYWEPIYDPNHPEVRKIVTGVVDEIVDLFKPKYLHIGHDECGALAFVPRKHNREITALFSGSVKFLQAHLKEHNVRAMMWGDMLLGSRQFPSGAAHGDRQGAPTAAAVKDIPKDVIMADWHYYPYARPYPDSGGPRADFPSSLYFSDKGFDVLGTTLGKLATNEKLRVRWQRHRTHNQNFAKFVANLNPDRARSKGRGLGMIVSHWYLNPVWLDALRTRKAMSVLTAADQFWNAGERRDPVYWGEP